MKNKRSILTTTITPALALAMLLTSLPTAEGVYWNRNRNRRGSAGDGGHHSSSSSQSSQSSRGRDLDRDGIPNIVDADVDNDGIPNGDDRNVDGGVPTSGPLRGRYIGDRLPNNHPAERDIDDDGLADDAAAELDIDGDGIPNTTDDDIDGDGVTNADDPDDDGDGILDADDATPRGSDGSTLGGGSAPAALTGSAYTLKQPNGSPDRTLNFTSATTGTDVDAGGTNGFTYSYTASGATASLRVQFKPDKWHEYDLNYLTGFFVRREFDKNVLDDTDTGSFVAGAGNPGGGNPGGGTPINGGTAPAAISGANWVVRQPGGAVEANLLFASTTNGSENDPDGDIDPFAYTYSANGSTATLRLDFQPGKWDEYDLNFATGTYTRREFKNSALDDTDTGTFAAATP